MKFLNRYGGCSVINQYNVKTVSALTDEGSSVFFSCSKKVVPDVGNLCWSIDLWNGSRANLFARVFVWKSCWKHLCKIMCC